jgi:excisionase family DNA binding protein
MTSTLENEPEPIQRRYFDTAEAAKYIGASVPYLEKLRASGEGPRYARAGRFIRYRADWLDDFMEAIHVA